MGNRRGVRGAPRAPEHPDTLRALERAADTLTKLGERAQAEGLYRDVLEASKRVLGPQHPTTVAREESLQEFLGQE